ncbi:MAG: hypothetical protein JWM63_5607 [Gammaproteobacteria bacterium]|nr:hypothetical protein [Gammaproteobacteria bacterium]
MRLSVPSRRSAFRGGLTAFVMVLTACASTPSQPVVDRLDPDTGSTLTVMDSPVELLAEATRGAAGDPFAYIAPFETDQMGKRALFLWMTAPAPEGATLDTQLLCDGQPLVLQPVEGGLRHLGIAHAPYSAPAPWSEQWYFQLTQDALKCLAGAQTIALETHVAGGGESQRFTVGSKNLAALKAFSTRQSPQ